MDSSSRTNQLSDWAFVAVITLMGWAIIAGIFWLIARSVQP